MPHGGGDNHLSHHHSDSGNNAANDAVLDPAAGVDVSSLGVSGCHIRSAVLSLAISPAESVPD
jgi:hypothetical protein